VTTLRPEREGADLYGGHEHAGGYVPDPYAAVDHLTDPLTDPLPGQHAPHIQHAQYPPPAPQPGPYHPAPQQPHYPAAAPAPPAAPAPRAHTPDGGASDTAVMPVLPDAPAAPDVPAPTRSAGRRGRRAAAPGPAAAAAPATAGHAAPSGPSAPAPAPVPAPGGRAARRRAAQAAQSAQEGRGTHAAQPDREQPATAAPGGHRRRQSGGHGGHGRRARNGRGTRAASASAAGAGAAEAPAGPTSRLEARRLARAAKESPMVVGSRVLGEVFITFGVVMLLFVVYQLWWTNVRAHQAAGGAAKKLEQQWRTDGHRPKPSGAFEPGQGFAIMYIPKLDVKAPIAEGVDKHKVLDKGMIGHYSGSQETAMPWAKTGNFAVAAHRNTHGEPFRYINKLVPGDKVIVETAKYWYTYSVTSMLPQTPPSNTTVLRPIPTGSGFTGPGRYLTLTTCTPEFTSKYRLIVWGKMVEERPRSKGEPAALAG
jgi:sortase A